jgi:hypothetical protein
VRIVVAHLKRFGLFGPDRFEVVICVHFLEIEEGIIATHGLQRVVVIERMPTVFKASNGERRETRQQYLSRKSFNKHAR